MDIAVQEVDGRSDESVEGSVIGETLLEIKSSWYSNVSLEVSKSVGEDDPAPCSFEVDHTSHDSYVRIDSKSTIEVYNVEASTDEVAAIICILCC
jgi:hypothetical protein